jgi:hypothetical protein
MTFICPKCGRYGMEWEARAKILICCYWDCNHIIRGGPRFGIPSNELLTKVIQEGKFPTENKST